MDQLNLETLATRLDAMERRAVRAERRGRARAILGTLALAASLIVVSAPEAAAQLGITLSSLSARVDALTAALNTEKADRASGDATLQSSLSAEAIGRATADANLEVGTYKESVARATADTALQAAINQEKTDRVSGDAALASRATGLETKTQYMLVSGTNTIFRGTNVMVQSGSGATDGTVNGLGNLIVGYNEVTGEFGDERGGSHNLVVGPYHDYLSYGGVVFGYVNGIRGVYASVTGGAFNIASGQSSSVSGGSFNTASGQYSSISGGRSNVASAYSTSISGGFVNTASGNYGSISGGNGNTESRTFGWRASSTLTN